MAGASASYIVLSPASALPRATMPSSPARSAVSNAGPSRTVASPTAVAARRKNVPYSGPLAPPTEVTRVMPTFLRRSPAFPGGGSTAAITASMPRIRLAPWSASPIAESSSVR